MLRGSLGFVLQLKESLAVCWRSPGLCFCCCCCCCWWEFLNRFSFWLYWPLPCAVVWLPRNCPSNPTGVELKCALLAVFRFSKSKKVRLMMNKELSEEALLDLYAWIDKIKFSRPMRNISRDFSDGGNSDSDAACSHTNNTNSHPAFRSFLKVCILAKINELMN